MWNAFDRAERWRQRAVELRAVADRMSENKARSALTAIAAALDQHARTVEEMALMALKTHRARPAVRSLRRKTG